MSDHDRPQLETSTVYEGDTGEVAILIQELWAAGTDYTQVAFTVADDAKKTITTEIDPEYALEIAAGIAAAAHLALTRREMGW